MKKEIVLATQSPRRRELFHLLDIPFTMCSSEVEEVIDYNQSVEDIVQSLALQKANDVLRKHRKKKVLGFDTLVVLDDHIMGKPKNKVEAKEMLKKLSNRSHRVLTGCAIVSTDSTDVFYTETFVFFRKLSDKEILDYVESGDPLDKAGAYGIQSGAAKFVEKIDGDYYSVMGLPVCALSQKL